MKLLHNCLFVTEKALTVVVLLAFACAVFFCLSFFVAFLLRIVAAHGLAGSCFLQTDCLILHKINFIVADREVVQSTGSDRLAVQLLIEVILIEQMLCRIEECNSLGRRTVEPQT